MKRLFVWLLRGYQLLVSPMLGQNCRFYPSCSSYAIEALEVHGAARGGYLALRRVCRCHPWHAGGVDPVPGVASAAASPSSPTACKRRHS
jgi:putative membrane protein insertion efficiency factor